MRNSLLFGFLFYSIPTTFIFSTFTPAVALRYVQSVIPAPLLEPEWPARNGTAAGGNNGGNGRDAGSTVARDLRILTVISLMQQLTPGQGWQLYEGQWFRLFEFELQWIPAENFCRQLGGHLASIRDAAENDFVHRLRKKNNIWIGLNKLDAMAYEWSDGTTEAAYLNWDSTQPNEPHVHCAYMAFNQDQRQGTWFDYACHQKLPQYFVCKLRL